MSNVSIVFQYAWILLLIIPATVLLLYIFFRRPKKFRVNRNNVISLVCSFFIFIPAIIIFSGLTVSYASVVADSEIIIVVDCSYSNATEEYEKNKTIQSIIESAEGISDVGIVAYGSDCKYAVELTSDLGNIYEDYLDCEMPSGDGTNIAQALEFANEKFTTPVGGKIVLITDGIETDGNALTTVAKIAMNGTKVDVIECSNSFSSQDIMAIGVVTPNETLVVGNQIQLELVFQSSISTDVQISLSCNDEEVTSSSYYLSKGTQSVYVPYTFTSNGLQQFKLDVTGFADNVSYNNTIYSYVFLDLFEEILILENGDDGEQLKSILDVDYNATILDIKDAPDTVSKLLDYEQVILVNVANSDMPEGFIDVLYEYVYEEGGGLLTIGGTKQQDGETVANTYNREDLDGTLYQDMLPVVAEDYTPPIAVVLVIDESASMQTWISQAKDGAIALIDELDDRDYVGVVTYNSTATTAISITPVSQRLSIQTTIKNMTAAGGATVLSPGLERAGAMLATFNGVASKHIICLVDGDDAVYGSDAVTVESISASNYANGITTSIVKLGSSSYNEDVYNLVTANGGSYYTSLFSYTEVATALIEDVSEQLITEMMIEDFTPSFGNSLSYFSGLSSSDIPSLGGFFGARLRSDATSYLVGDYDQPIYAAWDYGAGTVGSFMSDLNGEWSSEMISSDIGKLLIGGMVNSLFANQSIINDNTGIDIIVSQANLSCSAYIRATLEEGESLQAILSYPEESGMSDQTFTFSNFSGSATIEYDYTASGTYSITVQRIDSQGGIVTQKMAYQSFSYSEEYNTFIYNNSTDEFINNLAVAGDGSVVTDVSTIFDVFITSYIVIFDPRTILSIIIIVALLIDVIVRKFKFKWPHELIRAHREKTRSNG